MRSGAEGGLVLGSCRRSVREEDGPGGERGDTVGSGKQEAAPEPGLDVTSLSVPPWVGAHSLGTSEMGRMRSFCSGPAEKSLHD